MAVALFLQKVFKIRKGEIEKTALMFLYAFNWCAAFIIGRITKDTLFLNQANISLLPYMYIIVAVAVGSITIVYSRQVTRLSMRRVVNSTFLLVVLGLLAFRYLLTLSSQTWVYPALYVFIEIMGIMLMIQFWTFANELFNSREAKRLFAVIGGGQVLANLYSFPIRSLKDVIGISNLLFVCLASVLICFFIYNYLSRRYRLMALQHSRHVRGTLVGAIGDAMPRLDIFGNLKKRILLLTLLTMLTATFVDYQFKVSAKYFFSGDQLANYFFAVYAYGGLLACLVQFFFTSRILEKFGILWALLILPILLGGGSTLTLFAIGYIGVTMTKGSELVTRYTIYETTANLLYQPLPPAMRRKIKALSDGVVRPIAQAGGGLFFIVINAIFAISSPNWEYIQSLSYVTAALTFIWIFAIFSTRRGYVEALLISSDRRSGFGDTPEDEQATAVSRLVIQKALASGDDVQILNALEVIPLSRWSDWDDAILPLIESPHINVRKAAIDFLQKSGNRKFSIPIQKLFEDPDEGTRATAIQAYCSLEKERAVHLIRDAIHDPNPKIKAAAIAGLIHHGGLDGLLASTAELKAMIDSSDILQREMGARVLGHIRIKSFYQPLFILINDPDIKVQIAAIEAAGQIQSAELIPSIIYKLEDITTRAAAMDALAEFGESIYPHIKATLALPTISPELRNALPMVLAQIGSPESYRILEPLIETGEPSMRSAVSRALHKLHGRLLDQLSPNFTRLQNALHREFELYYQLLAHAETVAEGSESGAMLVSALHERAEMALARAFSLLGILYPRDQIDIVSYNLKSRNPAMRAMASEIIDNICENETKRYLLPILDTLEHAEKVHAGKRLFHLDSSPLIDILRRFLKDKSDHWLAACSIMTVGERKVVELSEDIARLSNHPDPIVRETVLFAMSRLLPTDDYKRFCGRFASEQDKAVRGYIQGSLHKHSAIA